jgi:hypothetical protein
LLAILIGWLAAWVAPLVAIVVVIITGMCFLMLGWRLGDWVYDVRNALDYDPWLIVRLFLVDLLLAIWLLARMSRLSPRTQTTQADERLPWLSALLTDREHLPIGGMLDAGLWRRVRHRRQIGLGHRFVWIVAVYLAVLAALAPLLASATWVDLSGYAFGALILAGVTSALAVGLAWPRRYADLGDVELLRPAARADFGREIALAMLCDSAELSVATVLGMLGPVAFWSPGAFESASFWNAAGATVLSQALVFGVIAWTMRRKSTAATAAGLIVAVLATILLIDQGLKQNGVIPALLAAAIGAVLAADAFRRWRRADAG